MKQTLEKRLLVDISAMPEMIERNEITVKWINREKQMSDVLAESGVPLNIMLQTFNNQR